MKEADKEEQMLRQYLLDELGEDEQEYFEERFITSRDFKERALIAEDELVEDYLSGHLSEAEKKSFVSHFLSTPEQRRKVRIAASLRKHMAASQPAHPTEAGGEVRSPSVTERVVVSRPFWGNPWVLVPASLTLVLTIVLGLVWVLGERQRRRHLAEIRWVLEHINANSVQSDSPSVFLSPLNVRGDREVNIMPVPAPGTVAQLWLVLIKDEYPSYQVVFQKDDDAEQFPVNGLQAETTTRGRAIPLRVPAEIVSPGTYVLKLNGVAEGERIEEVGEYNLRVTH
jgi:hypothetical protein